ncbi:DUF6274 family protein [Streptomyces sp. GSL17-113]|uniref:DUF6274 family protein n=1 Tax=Streptomyces sp. GSL17-113 TaxID=3115365 RepID=UPI002E783F9A|nr:DUF6274 family protein [Streptomyces sp. GSL17-113]
MTAGARDGLRAEARALLRAHLAATGRHRHTRRHCPVCHRLLRLALATTPRNASREELREPR